MPITLGRQAWALLLAAMPRQVLDRLDNLARRHAKARAERRRRALLARRS